MDDLDLNSLPSQRDFNSAMTAFNDADIINHAIEMSFTYFGSLRVQKLLSESEIATQLDIFHTVQPSLHDLMENQYGAHVIEKILECRNDYVNGIIVHEVMIPNLVHLCSHDYGSQAIQKAIEVAQYNMKMEIVDNLGEQHVVDLLDNDRGYHLLEKIIEHVSEDDANVVFHACFARAPDLVMHPYGCHVLRRIVNKTTNDEALDGIIRAAINAATDLAASEFGYYLLKAVVVRCSENDRWEICHRLTSSEPIFKEQMKSEYSYFVFEELLRTCNSSHVSMMLERLKYLLRSPDGLDKFSISRVRRLVDYGVSRTN